MTRIIPQRELRNDNAKVLDEVVAGEDFVVTRNGLPVAELRPIASAARRTAVPRSELAALFARGVPIDRTRFRRDVDEVVDQSLER